MSSAPTVELPATLVEAVGRTFRRYGYEGATMSLFSQETGLGRSSLYHHFPAGKVGMAHAALDRVEHFLRDDLGPLVGPGAGGDQGGTVARLLLEHFENGSLGCLLGAFSLQGCPPDVAERVRVVMELWIGQFETLFRNRIDDKARAHAERAVAAIQGALILATIQQDPEPVRCTLFELLELPG